MTGAGGEVTVHTAAFARLGIEPTIDLRQIRRAYAQQLKACNPEVDPEGFQALRAAYEQALAMSRSRPAPPSADVLPRPAQDAAPAPTLAAAGDDLTQACARLLQLVQSPAARSEEDLREAAHAVLSSEALEAVDRQRHVESWLAWLIVRHIPAADAIIEPAIARFGWRSGASFDSSGEVQTVLQRASDLAYLEQLRKPNAVDQRPFRAVSRPPKRLALVFALLWTPLGGEVREFLERIAYRHPTLLHEFNPAALAWWQGGLRPMSWPPGLGYWLLVAAAIGSVVGYMGFYQTPVAGHAMAIGGLIGAAMTAAVTATVVYGFGALRDYWRDNWMWRAPAWVEASWLAAAALLLAASIFAPPTALGAILVAIGALAVVILTHVVADGPAPGAYGRQVLLFNIPLVIWWVWLTVAPMDGSMLPRAIAAITAGYVFSYGALTIFAWVHLFMSRRWRLLLALATALSIALSGRLILAPDARSMERAGAVAVFITFIILLQRAAALRLGGKALQGRYFVMMGMVWIFPVLIAPVLDGPALLTALAVGGGWFLVGAAYTLAAALLSEARTA